MARRSLPGSASTTTRCKLQELCLKGGRKIRRQLRRGARAVSLQMPAPNPQAIESANAFMARVARIDVLLCPVCRQGRLHITAVLAGQGRLPAPAGTVLPQSRGPP